VTTLHKVVRKEKGTSVASSVRRIEHAGEKEKAQAPPDFFALVNGRIAGLLTVPGKPASTGIEVHQAIKKGIKIKDADFLKKRLGISDKEMAAFLGTSPATLQRKRQRQEAISFVQGDRLYRMARVLAKAVQLFGDNKMAVDWLKTPRRGLGGKIPLDLMGTEAGAQEVEDLIGRLQHGVIS
jgi:putative toxin-antitoxin system antitoxin component (TIGR02293 family)